jgi:hypothetical protein
MDNAQNEQARAYAFQQWAQQHHGDFGTGPKFDEIKNMELPSNLGGPVDIDWLASMGNQGALAKGAIGALTYMAGKEAWFALRAEKPDRSTFASTYPDSNWRAVSAADLLLSGKASVEQVFLPGQATQVVQDKLWQHQFQRAINDSVPFLSSSTHQAGPGGVLMETPVGQDSFRRSGRTLDGYLCVSLKALARAAETQLQAGSLSDAIAWVGGLTWIDGVVVDKNQDLVLIGRVLNRPGIHLDDVALLLRNAEGPAPYCSLDPFPENILRLRRKLAELGTRQIPNVNDLVSQLRSAIGDQEVVLGNLPPSRAGEVLIFADYDMKKLSQGLLSATGLTSMLDISVAKARQALAQRRPIPVPAAMSRFWFCIGQDQPAFGTNDTGTIWLEDCKVVVRTELQVTTSRGQLLDASGPPDNDAEAFAANFSVGAVASEYPSIAALENLFRLQALLHAAAFLNELEQADLTYLRQRYPLQWVSHLPPSLPGLASGKTVSVPVEVRGEREATAILTPVVCGGVDLDVTVRPKSLIAAKPDESALGTKALSMRPDAKTVFWGIRQKP